MIDLDQFVAIYRRYAQNVTTNKCVVQILSHLIVEETAEYKPQPEVTGITDLSGMVNLVHMVTLDIGNLEVNARIMK